MPVKQIERVSLFFGARFSFIVQAWIRSIIVLILIFSSLSLASCMRTLNSATPQTPTNTPTSTPDPDHQTLRTKDLLLAGKVINSKTHEWPNGRLVLLYLKGDEIARTETSRGELTQSGIGINDGFFKITAENIYGLTIDILNRNPASPIDFLYGQDNDLFSPHDYLYHWFGDVEEGDAIRIPIPEKNIEYVLVVLKGEKDSLPSEILTAGSTQLRSDGRIVYDSPADPDAQVAAPDTSVRIGETTYAIKEELVELSRISVPSDNCQGNSDIEQTFTKDQSYTHKFEEGLGLELKLPLPAWLKLLATLEGKYGFEQGEVKSENLTYNIVTKAGTKQVVTFIWKEKWESGVSKVTVGEHMFEIPFRVKKELIYEVENNQLPCP